MHLNVSTRIVLSVVLAVMMLSMRGVPKSVRIRGDYPMVRSVQAIPEPVRLAFLNSIEAARTYGVAEPDDQWTPGCVIGPHNPLHQLSYAANFPPYWVIAFRHGGFASGEGLYVFRFREGKVDRAWSDLRLPYGESKEAFVSRLERGDACFVSPPRIFYYVEELEECRHDT